MSQQTMDAVACAKGILNTWERGDLAGLEAALHSAQRAAAGQALSTEEEERLQLLEGIAGQMRREMAHGGIAQPETYRRLLRHLAANPAGKPSFFRC